MWLSGRAGSCADTGPLYLGTLDLRGETNLAPKKVFVVVTVLVTASGKSLEAVQVKLSCNRERVHKERRELDDKLTII